jgi:hypothetical protein
MKIGCIELANVERIQKGTNRNNRKFFYLGLI